MAEPTSALAGSIGQIGGAIGGIGSLVSGISSLLPTTQKSSSNFSGATNTRTQQTNFDEDAVKRIIDIMLQSTDGLQAVNAPERASGLFDTSTTQLLTNNLLATIGGEVARLTAPTTVTENLGPYNTRTKTKSSKCFITTAVCTYMGLGDDCKELETLRKFRDTYMKENHAEEITQYYAEAPAIVDILNSRENRAYIWKVFYDNYISIAVNAINNEDYYFAYRIYRALFNEAKYLSQLEIASCPD